MCHSWRLCVCIPEDRSRSGPKGSTNKPYLQQKARKGGVVGGGGKSTDVPFSFCLLLLSPFSSFNLVNTCCSYNMLRGQNPSPPTLSLASAPRSPNLFAYWSKQLLRFPALLCPDSHPSAPHQPPLRLWSAEKQ